MQWARVHHQQGCATFALTFLKIDEVDYRLPDFVRKHKLPEC